MVVRSKITIPLLTFLMGLAACTTLIPFEVREFNNVAFSPAKMIRVESGDEIVPISARLGNELTRAGFKIAGSGEDAAYILTFDYHAEFDVSPWIIRSFTLSLTNTASGNVIYSLQSSRPGREPFDSLLRRIAADMSSKLLTNPMRGNVTLIVGEEDK